MISTICTNLTKIPVFKQIAQSLYRFMSRTLSESTNMKLAEANDLVSAVYTKPTSTVTWERNAGETCYDLSIIIPFYKTEAFAVRCIESALNQISTFSVELILVDDGSPDRCGEILDSYSCCDDVVVIHQKNSGLSGARNIGLKTARGEYVLFVDSDDYLLPNAVQTLMEATIKYDADIVEGSHYTFSDRGIQKQYIHRFAVGKAGAGMFGYAWGKVIRSAYFDKICFPVGLWYEDTVIGALIYPMAKISVCVENLTSGYFINQQGISAQTKVNPKCIDALTVLEPILDYYVKNGGSFPENLRTGMLYQLGSVLRFRTRTLSKELQSLYLLQNWLISTISTLTTCAVFMKGSFTLP